MVRWFGGAPLGEESTSSGGGGLGDSAGAGEAVEREESAVMEEQHSVGDATHTRELVGRDDRGRGGDARLANQRRSLGFATQT